MFVAVCDQKRGNSTSFWSNAGPSLPGISAWRELPLDLVERVAAGDREEPLRGDARALVDDRVDVVVRRRGASGAAVAACRCLRGRHACLPAVRGSEKSVLRPAVVRWEGFGMLGGGSDGAHDPDSATNRDFPAICRKRASPAVVRSLPARVRLRGGRGRRCRRRRRRRSCGGGGSRPSRPRGAARRGRRARAAAPAPTTARRCRSCSVVSGRVASVVSVVGASSRRGRLAVSSSWSSSVVRRVRRRRRRTGVGSSPPGSGFPCFAKASARPISSFAFE